MREVSVDRIREEVKRLCIEGAYILEEDVQSALKSAFEREVSPMGREVLTQIIKNYEIALDGVLPMCQDTGIAVVFVEVGRDVRLDGSLEDAINQGVREGYGEGYLRKSVCHPLTRQNTGDNTPAVIHTRITEGDRVKIKVALKGAGSENKSSLKMLNPTAGVEAIKEFVTDTVREAGGSVCPPIVVGVGIGGDFEKSAILSKEAILRPIGRPHQDETIAGLEEELLEEVNKLGIGPMGFGGTVTALAVHIEVYPCHIASLPVSVNIQCHADRHKEVVI